MISSFLFLGVVLLVNQNTPRIPYSERSKFGSSLGGFETATRVYWDEYLVPFIEAGSDHDLARAIGIVHAHLRLGQMELLRRITAGRLSEMAGPFTIEIDQLLRTLDLAGAGEASLKVIDPSTLDFLQSYVDGLNAYVDQLSPLPPEFRLGGIKPEPWTVAQVAAITRLAGLDINWLLFASYLTRHKESQWPSYWKLLSSQNVQAQLSSLGFENGIFDISRSGSNAFAVSGQHTASGSALLAADPHVGFQLPNLWMLIGLKSPTFHCTGMMLPGVPVVLSGRNEQIAWGATNMRALSSGLFELSDEEVSAAKIEKSIMKIRWWPDSEFVRRRSALGPVISDLERFSNFKRPVALRWIGQDPSDELSSFLRVMKAANWEEFQSAFSTYAVSGQNYIYADRQGNIGQFASVKLPKIKFSPDLLRPSQETWRETTSGIDLPRKFNPNSGFVASANNKPFSDPDEFTRVGIAFSAEDRITRLNELLGEKVKRGRFIAQDAREIQSDVFSPSHYQLLQALLPKWKSMSSRLTKGQRSILSEIEGWDGRYEVTSRSALLFQLASFHLLRDLFTAEFGSILAKSLLDADSAATIALDFLEKVSQSQLQEALSFAATSAGQRGNWGTFHFLRLEHPFARIPVLGYRYRFATFPVSGGGTTLFKTYNGFTGKRHAARYGANSRFIYDLSDLDSSQAVLMGGQDGMLNSENFVDQVPLWQNGSYLPLPLRLETIRRRAKAITTFSH